MGVADALWTAVTAKDPALIDESEKSIKQLHEQGKMTPESNAVLEEIIANTRSGDWDKARGKLKQFARGQRRAGSS